jgi:hypothetical protein
VALPDLPEVSAVDPASVIDPESVAVSAIVQVSAEASAVDPDLVAA